jgi:hypothetical protein
MSSSPTTQEDFPELAAHKAMWTSYTHLLVRSIIAIVIGVLFIGFVTGTL